MKKYLLIHTAMVGLLLNINTSHSAALLTDHVDAGTIVVPGALGSSVVRSAADLAATITPSDIPWTYDSSLGLAVKLRGSEVLESKEVSPRIESVIPNIETFGSGNSGTLSLTQIVVLPDGMEERLMHTVSGTKSVEYIHNDGTLQSIPKSIYRYLFGRESKSLEQLLAPVAYAAGAISRALPTGRVLTPADTTTTLTITKNYTRPDGTTHSVAEVSAPLPITKTHLRYTHDDASHQSTSVQQYKVTHEGVVVTLPGEYSGAVTSHTKAVGATSETSRREEGANLVVNFREPTTYSRADGTTYSQERTFTERWPITEPECTEDIGSSWQVKTWEGATHWWTGKSTKSGVYRIRVGTYKERKATKSDGGVVTLKAKWLVSETTRDFGEWSYRD
jgi:hypothetical protein